MQMRKAMALILAFLMVLSLCACGQKGTEANSKEEQPTQAANPDSSADTQPPDTYF